MATTQATPTTYRTTPAEGVAKLAGLGVVVYVLWRWL